jgi:hypothetical protein
VSTLQYWVLVLTLLQFFCSSCRGSLNDARDATVRAEGQSVVCVAGLVENSRNLSGFETDASWMEVDEVLKHLSNFLNSSIKTKSHTNLLTLNKWRKEPNSSLPHQHNPPYSTCIRSPSY